MSKYIVFAMTIAALLIGAAPAQAAVLQSIAVTPANPAVAKGLTQQFTATGTFSDNTTQNLTSQVTWASATTSVATITRRGPGDGGGRRARRTISATLGGDHRLDGADGHRGGAAVDRGDAGQPERREGADAAVHGDRHVLRQLDAEPDQPGDVGVGDDRRWPRSPAGGPGDRRGDGHVDDQRDAGRRSAARRC